MIKTEAGDSPPNGTQNAQPGPYTTGIIISIISAQNSGVLERVKKFTSAVVNCFAVQPRCGERGSDPAGAHAMLWSGTSAGRSYRSLCQRTAKEGVVAGHFQLLGRCSGQCDVQMTAQ